MKPRAQGNAGEPPTMGAQDLGENVALFAEPAQNYLPDPTRTNLTATLLACDKDCIATVDIPGKALLARKDGSHFKASTAKRLCHFVDSLFMLRKAGGSLEPEHVCKLPWSEQVQFLERAMEAARSNWPKYRIDNTLLADGSLQVVHPACEPPVELVLDQVKPPDCTNEVPDLRIREPPQSMSDGSSTTTVKVLVLQLSKSPAVLHEHLAKNIHLHGCKMALQQAGLDYRLPCGAYLLVVPEVYPFILALFETEGFPVHHSDLIVSLCYEDAVMRAIYSLPRKYKLCIRHHEVLEIPAIPEIGTTDEEPNEVDIHVEIKCTFIHIPIPSSLRTVPSDGPRTASTTDAQQCGRNPRRAVKRHGHR